MNRTLLSLAIACAVAPGAWAQDAEEEIEQIIVTATPLNTPVDDSTVITAVLTGGELRERLTTSIGETVNNLPGIHSAFFGAGVGRPIIRGQDGLRIAVLENNISSNDVSAVSADHAVSIEPFLARQVEVLHGPATLLYGSDTIGGVVNVRTNRLPEDMGGDGVSGSLVLEGDSVADGLFGGAEINGQSGRIAYHLDAFYRDADDYDIPGFAEREGADDLKDEDDEEEAFGTLPNSGVETEGFAAGLSYLGDSVVASITVSTFDTLYGIPAGEEEEEEDEDDKLGLKGGGEEVSIDLEQTKIDGRLAFANPFDGIEQIELLISDNDYEHVELEGDEIGTQFDTDTLETRLEVTHNPIGGWRGTVGIHYRDRDFSALGEEAFVPPSTTEQQALFIVEEKTVGDVRYEVGLRIESQDTDAISGLSASHDPFSISGGAVWRFNEDFQLMVNLARTERAPSEVELFADGPHLATGTFEIGNPNLVEERNTSFDLTLATTTSPLTGSLSYYQYNYDDFIYLNGTGLVEDGLPVFEWLQADADISGWEGELALSFGEGWRASMFFDSVTAELDNGGDLPRTPPNRFGAGLDWDWNQWQFSLDAIRYDDQDDIGAFERPTDSYTMINADVVYNMGDVGGLDWQFYLRGRNLDDEEARNHTSFVVERAPLPGRNFILGLRAAF
ncbi:MAG: TonB-dependent receptor [Xanthomonadales bacterium]|nr:TonB-dependent receptor [Xanthomonadales bacterium]